MKQNMGLTDRAARMLVAIIVASLYFADVITGITAIILPGLAGVFILTGLAGFCPLYLLFGASTRNKSK